MPGHIDTGNVHGPASGEAHLVANGLEVTVNDVAPGLAVALVGLLHCEADDGIRDAGGWCPR